MLKTYALFDFDGTLIRGDSILLFLRYAWRKKLCGIQDLLCFAAAGLLFALRMISPKRAKEMGLHFLTRRERAVFDAAAEDFVQTVLVPRLYPQGLEAIRGHQQAGHEVVLISASPEFYLKPLARELGLTAVLATEFSAHENGSYAGEILGHNCRGNQKPHRLELYLAEAGDALDYETSSAYGDSAHDLPMLALCAHAYAVNPKRTLKDKLYILPNVTVLHWKEKP